MKKVIEKSSSEAESYRDLAALRSEVERAGFAFAAGASMGELLGPLGDWPRFAASWNDLPRDEHLPDGHRYRRRRHATLSARAGAEEAVVEKHQAHYQGLEYNSLVGGIERWFEPVKPEVLGGETFRAVLRLCLRLFGALRADTDWHIECHQFRIEARAGAEGLPTPEGVHRDGVDYVLVLMVDRANIESGTTTLHDASGAVVGRFTLERALDAVLVDDNRMRHGVTAVHPLDPSRPAHRDVLVVTFRARPYT